MTALLLTFALSLAATDLTGTWTLKYEKDFSGHPEAMSARFSNTVRNSAVHVAAKRE